MRRTETTTFEEITAKAVHHGRCSVCGGRTRRSRTFAMTVSPFNRAPGADRPRTRHEVELAVEAKAAEWNPPADLFRHEGCEPS